MLFLKKTLAVCMIGFGVRGIISASSSRYRVGIWYRSNPFDFRINLVMQVKKKR